MKPVGSLQFSAKLKTERPVALREGIQNKTTIGKQSNNLPRQNLTVFPNPVTPQQPFQLVLSGFDTVVNISLFDKGFLIKN